MSTISVFRGGNMFLKKSPGETAECRVRSQASIGSARTGDATADLPTPFPVLWWSKVVAVSELENSEIVQYTLHRLQMKTHLNSPKTHRWRRTEKRFPLLFLLNTTVTKQQAEHFQSLSRTDQTKPNWNKILTTAAPQPGEIIPARKTQDFPWI